MNAARALWAEWANPFTTREVSHRAVNALPAIADLLDALAEHVKLVHPSNTFCAACYDDWPCATATARDAVAAALTGETP